MSNKKKKGKNLIDEDVEHLLDQIWENWSSRRSCESRHTPEYIKRQKKSNK